MNKKIFDPKQLKKLNNPQRLIDIPPTKIVELLPKNSKTILDFGAGTGFFTKEFSKLLPNATIYASDISEKMINYINNEILPNYNNIIPILDNNNSLKDIKQNSLDAIIMINIHHELDNRVELLKKLHSLLNNSGKIIICDWKKEDMDFGPSIEIRHDSLDVKKQLIKSGYNEVIIDNNLKYNYIISAKK